MRDRNNKSGKYPVWGPYEERERVPMLLLGIALVIAFTCFLVWAVK